MAAGRVDQAGPPRRAIARNGFPPPLSSEAVGACPDMVSLQEHRGPLHSRRPLTVPSAWYAERETARHTSNTGGQLRTASRNRGMFMQIDESVSGGIGIQARERRDSCGCNSWAHPTKPLRIDYSRKAAMELYKSEYP